MDDRSTEQQLAPLRELLAIAQTGLAFTRDPYDQERYTRLREIVSGMLVNAQAAEPRFDPSVFLEMEKGYATPKVDVRGAAFRDGRVLLVRERSDGLWALPGGWADVNH